MKSTLTVIFIVCYSIANSQPTGTNILHYKAPKLFQYTAENFLQANQKIIYSADIGFNTDIYIDTVFRNYYIYLTTSAGERQVAKFEYVSDYYAGGKRQNNMAVVTMNKERFIVWDMSNISSPLNQIYFIFEKDIEPNQTRFLLLTHLEKAD